MKIRKSRAGVVQSLTDLEFRGRSRSPKQCALQFLREHLDLFGLSPDLRELHFERTCKTPLGWHVYLQQHHAGLGVGDAWMRLDLDPSRQLVQVANRCRPPSELRQAFGPQRPRAEVPAAVACDIARRRSGPATRETPVLPPQLTIRKLSGKWQLAWKVILDDRSAGNPCSHHLYYIDAQRPRYLTSKPHSFRAPDAMVFNPNPLVSLNNPALGAQDSIPDTAYIQVPLQGLNGGTHLDGEYATTAATPGPRTTLSSNLLSVRRGSRAFCEIMAYYHADAAQRYLQSLGYSDAHQHPVQINATGNPGERSEYFPATDTIELATGGIPDAEDAEVIVHEYAHAVHTAIFREFGWDTISVNMAEGFADYFAASVFAETKSAALKPFFGTWDSRSDQPTAQPPALRRLDRPEKFADVQHVLQGRSDLVTQFWGRCLWDLRSALGRQIADTVIVGSLYVMQRTLGTLHPITYRRAADGLWDACWLGYKDQALLNIIHGVLRDRGIYQ